MFEFKKIARVGAIATGAMMLCAVSTANATPFSLPGSPMSPIDNNTPTMVTIVGAGTDVITHLNVSILLNDLQGGGIHTYWDDMDMTIEHNGTTVTLNIGNAAAYGEFNVMFDDAGADLSLVTTDATSSFAPEGGLLSDFNGHTLDGNWNLTFTDNSATFAPIDCPSGCYADSELISWSISGDASAPTTTPVPEPGTMAMFGLGLAGLGFIRRRKVA